MDDVNSVYAVGNLSRIEVKTFQTGTGSFMKGKGKFTCPSGTFWLQLSVSSPKYRDFLEKLGEENPDGVTVGLLPAYLDSWYHKTRDNWNYEISVRPTGLKLLPQMRAEEIPLPPPQVIVSGEVESVQGNIVLLGSKYSYRSAKASKTVDAVRHIMVTIDQPISAPVGSRLLVMGQPQPRLGEDWLVHVDSHWAVPMGS